MDAVEERNAIGRVLAGDHDAYEELFVAYQRLVIHLARQALRNEESALDVAQEVFLRAFNELPRWRGEARLSTWLHRTAFRVCSEYIRAERRRLSLTRVSEAGTVSSPESALLDGEVRATIAQAVDRLPPRQRAVFDLRLYHDMRFPSIARRLGISEGCVRASYHRSLSFLRQRLKDMVPETPSSGATTGRVAKHRWGRVLEGKLSLK